jgi:TolB-like protein
MIGRRVAHYQIIEKLGAGGMGEVWRAHDTRLDRDVALKVLPADRFSDENARARLVREARTASRLNHPHICTIHEVGEADGQTYIAMELVEGRTLSARLAEGALPASEVLGVGLQIAGAVAHAHERGVVHRDLKSANVILTPEGRVKVLDFGLAKRMLSEAAEDAPTQTMSALTAPGVVVGTPAYMAPEQLRGEAADARSDVWALGVVLYEMAAGRRPFQGRSTFEVSSAILKESPVPLPAAVPGELGALIARYLVKEPAARYQQAKEVQRALEPIQVGTAAPWAGWRYELSRRRWLVAAGAAATSLAGLAVGLRGRLWGPQRAVRLAVLPFVNLSGDAEQEYLSDGMTQEMITQLGSLHPASLSVIARTSVMRYKKSDKPIDEVARELNVDYILEGSARRDGGRVRIAAELIRVKGQTQLWAETYEREMAGVLALQSEVAKKVASSLALKLLPAEQARLANVRQVHPEAYDAYLRGSHYHSRLTEGDLETAEQYFNLALQKDPAFADAYAGLARVWTGRQQVGITPPSEAGPKAKAAVRKALELDDSNVTAHRALASILTWTDWDWAAADRQWKRLLELNRGDADTLSTYSHYLMLVRRPDEAMAQAKRAKELDPFHAKSQSFYTVVLETLGRYDEAVAQARSVLRIQPGQPIATKALIRAVPERHERRGRGRNEEQLGSDQQPRICRGLRARLSGRRP